MTTADLTTLTLTADDLAALKQANTVSFHYYKGRGYIRATLDGGVFEPRIYTAREQRIFNRSEDGKRADRSREIDTETGITGYGTRENASIEWTERNEPLASAFEMIMTVQYSDEWRTIVRMLRVGDRISLLWLANNNNSYVRDAGLHRDELRLCVDRDKSAPLVFLVDVSVCQDNSARMIRRHG